MCKKVLYLTFFFAFCTTAMASDIAISTQQGWFGTADREMQEIVNNVKGVNIQVFTSSQQGALATWVADHTGDGVSDLLILCGQFPSTIYAAGNAQPDGSLAELFLDDGNTIINTGDYMFYVVDNAGANAAGGLQNMMDIAGITMWDDDTAVVVTAEGQKYTPTLKNFATDRPFHLNELTNNWAPELILAQNAAGTRADPVIVKNSVTGGRLGIFFQTAGQDDDPRGEVISEWINNWWLKYVYEPKLKAWAPNPKDGATGVTSPLLQWKAGDTAAFHDVYFGTNPTPGAAEYRGRQILSYNMYWHLPGITPGVTYYWRIDEVEADGITIHTGNVWSFTAAPLTAYNPNPSDGAKWIDIEADLSWSAGAGAVWHDVYFGTDQAAVANGTGNTLKSSKQTKATYDPGTLAKDTTYYWRIDEYTSGGTKYQGSVWSFTTIGPYAGIRGYYFNNMNLSGAPALVRIDPQINFNWGDGTPGTPIPVDLFSVRWVGVVEVLYSEPYIFTCNTDDGFRMWLNDELIIDSWWDQAPTMHSSPAIDLVAGQLYSVRVEYYENGGGAVAQLYWQSPSTPRQIIPAGALQLPMAAYNPSPSSGAIDVKQTPTLRWKAGEKAAKHNVYFGTDATAVENATTSTPGIYRTQRDLKDTSYIPTEAPLAWNKTYYWRIDEVNGVDLWKGSIWSFTTADFLVVDDFEDYTDDVGSRIFQTWKDGLGYTEPPPGYLGNGTGSTVGNAQTPYAEQTIVRSGSRQSMPLAYDNSGAGNKARYSETFREWASAQNWTINNVKVLTLYFYGAAANAAERLYVALEDNAGHVKVVNYPDLEAVQRQVWQEWNIALSEFSAAGVNLSAVKKIYIGLGNRTSPTFGGKGTIYIDDIRVYRSRCVASMAKPAGDIARPYDCKVDYKDLRVLAYEWLSAAQLQNWQERVAYWDSRYRTNWASEADSIAVRDGLAAAGYTILNADQLKAWMNARIADKKSSVVVFCRDNAPDTVVESVDATCTLRKYLDAGGKIVFYADIPFWDIAHADGTWDNPQTAGASSILGFDNTVVLWDSNTQVTLTDAGISWGLTQTWGSVRPIATTDVTVLATDAAGNAAAWVKHYLPGDTYRGFVRLYDRGGHPPVEDIIRAAEYGALMADLNGDKKVDFKDYAQLADAWLEEIWWP